MQKQMQINQLQKEDILNEKVLWVKFRYILLIKSIEKAHKKSST